MEVFDTGQHYLPVGHVQYLI